MTEPLPTSLGSRVRRLLMPLASPRLTVLLLALSIVLVFAGTLAQMNESLWEVLHDYFRSPLVFIPIRNFLPRDSGVSIEVPFPGGYTIGLMMLINLIAAHVARFRVQARASRLLVGVAMVVLGGGLIAWFHNGPLPQRIIAGAGGYQGVLPLMAAGAGFYAPLVIGCAITFGRRAGILEAGSQNPAPIERRVVAREAFDHQAIVVFHEKDAVDRLPLLEIVALEKGVCRWSGAREHNQRGNGECSYDPNAARTLHRHFSSKNATPWSPTEELEDRAETQWSTRQATRP